MPTEPREVARARWLLGHLDWATAAFEVETAGPSVRDHRLRTAGRKVLDHGDPAWLRVVYDDPEWGIGPYQDGVVTANDITGVPKPVLLRWRQWDDRGRTIRGELSTYVAERTIADDMLPPAGVELPDPWLTDLAHALHTLAGRPVPAHGVDIDDVRDGARDYFGIDVDPATVAWTAAHCDLHWGNLTAPKLWILDWEIWGRAPAGYDAATLYCTSLLQPSLAERIHPVLTEFLTGSAGRTAMIAAAVRVHRFIDSGELPLLKGPLRQWIGVINQS